MLEGFIWLWIMKIPWRRPFKQEATSATAPLPSRPVWCQYAQCSLQSSTILGKNFYLHVGCLICEPFHLILSSRTSLKKVEYLCVFVAAKVPHVACVLARFFVLHSLLSSRTVWAWGSLLFVFLCRTLSHAGRSNLPLFASSRPSRPTPSLMGL
jgi:hypothetical protein